MKGGVAHTSVKMLAVIYAGLLGLATVLAAPLFLLGWGVCAVLRGIVRVVRRVFSYLSALGEQLVKRMLNGKLPQSANATRRKHNVRQG